MPHLKCATCRTRLYVVGGPTEQNPALCPDCGSAFEPAGELAELVGYRAVTAKAQERWVDDSDPVVEAVALPRPETTC
jgi:hypothetical protein